MMPNWYNELPLESIRRIAHKHALDPLLVAAFCQVESSGKAAATRYERGYRWLVDPTKHARTLGLTFDTEVIAQSHSYGLMQVMGATARSLGYTDYCSLLVDVDRGLEYGCAYLARCLDRYKSMDRGIAAYNAGSPRDAAPVDGVLDNQGYVDKVLARLEELAAAYFAKPLA